MRVITIDLEDQASTDMECFGCCLARWLRVLQALGEQGMLDLPVAQDAQPR